jgi:hypothetical protein
MRNGVSKKGDSERTAKRDIVKVGRGLNCLHFSSDIEGVYAFVQVRYGGVGRVIRAKNLHCLLSLVGLVYVLDWKCIELYRNGGGVGDKPVMIASGSSSRGSRRAILAPGLIDRASMLS